MRIPDVVEGVASDLAALGALGNETTAAAARQLAVAMHGPLTARLLEVLGQMAVELAAVLPDQRVEVRLIGSDAQLVVVDAEPVEALDVEGGTEAEADARITLRLPAHLKTRVEEASTREGVSVNTYIVRALSHGTRGERGPKGGHRMRGHGHV